MWWKKNKWKVIVPALAAAILAAAFWYGGDAPSLRGWSVTQPTPTLQAAPEFTPDRLPENSPALPAETPEPTAGVTPEPTAGVTPEPTPEPPAQTQAMAAGAEAGEEEKPAAPAEPEDAPAPGDVLTCTVSVSCAAILGHMDWLDAEKTELVPADGWILRPTEVTFSEGESVFDVLQRVCRENGIHLEFCDTPMYDSAYIEGIGNLYEFDCGELSGWMYKVNDWFPNYGCSRCALSDGDVICWLYTCDLGADVGGSNAAGG